MSILSGGGGIKNYRSGIIFTSASRKKETFYLHIYGAQFSAYTTCIAYSNKDAMHQKPDESFLFLKVLNLTHTLCYKEFSKFDLILRSTMNLRTGFISQHTFSLKCCSSISCLIPACEICYKAVCTLMANITAHLHSNTM